MQIMLIRITLIYSEVVEQLSYPARRNLLTETGKEDGIS